MMFRLPRATSCTLSALNTRVFNTGRLRSALGNARAHPGVIVSADQGREQQLTMHERGFGRQQASEELAIVPLSKVPMLDVLAS